MPSSSRAERIGENCNRLRKSFRPRYNHSMVFRMAPWAGVAFAFAILAYRLAGAGASVPPIRFEDVAQKSGIDFVLHNCPTPQKHLIETMAGGFAAFD